MFPHFTQLHLHSFQNIVGAAGVMAGVVSVHWCPSHSCTNVCNEAPRTAAIGKARYLPPACSPCQAPAMIVTLHEP